MKKCLENPLLYAFAVSLGFFLESITAFDCFFQAPFFRNGEWFLSRAFHNEWKSILCTAPKIVIGIICGVCLLLFLSTVFQKRKHGTFTTWQKPALLAVVSISLTPLVVATLKSVTGVYSPVDLLPYGGEFPHIGFLKQLYLSGQVSGGRSFPAGHASGGFALMALYYLPLSRLKKKALLFTGLIAGWLMGLYQMGRGEHFLSHTLTSMFIALAIMTCAAKLIRIQPINKP